MSIREGIRPVGFRDHVVAVGVAGRRPKRGGAPFVDGHVAPTVDPTVQAGELQAAVPKPSKPKKKVTAAERRARRQQAIGSK